MPFTARAVGPEKKGARCAPLKEGTYRKLKPELEVEARLNIDGSRSERIGCLTKVRICDVGRYRARVDVQQVEDVEHVGFEFQLRAFAQNFHVGQTEALTEGDIDIPISGARKRVALDSWRRNEGGRRLARIIRDGSGIIRD